MSAGEQGTERGDTVVAVAVSSQSDERHRVLFIAAVNSGRVTSLF